MDHPKIQITKSLQFQTLKYSKHKDKVQSLWIMPCELLEDYKYEGRVRNRGQWSSLWPVSLDIEDAFDSRRVCMCDPECKALHCVKPCGQGWHEIFGEIFASSSLIAMNYTMEFPVGSIENSS